MRYLLLFLLIGCAPDVEKLKQSAENFCSCHGGVWYVSLNQLSDAMVKCNNGYFLFYDEEDIIYRKCE